MSAGSLSNIIFDKVREDILTGIYEAGEELSEASLARKYNASRTPVREALRQLESEGLVTIIPNKKVTVRGINPRDVYDIYAIRSRLESLCAGWAARNASDDQIAALEETVSLSDFYTAREEYDKVFEMDSRFHELLYQASGSPLLSHILTEFHQYIKSVRKASISNRMRTGSSNIEHRRIMEAVKARDPEKAELLAGEHIRHTLDNLAQYDIGNLLHAQKPDGSV